ncbi:MAG: vitamin K epoxide reductase family protein [Gemmatimonadota bacterium]|jgi:uncharacterized membrane protein
MNFVKRLFPILGLLVLMLPARLQAQTPESVVHAILFYHPTCPHCHQVITEYLIPLQEEYGRRVVILGMDTSQQWANNLYWEAIRYYEIPEDDWAVPMMIVGDDVFVGGIRIPNGFTPILEAGLAGDGVDLPNYPALVNFLREQDALDPRYPDRLIARQTPPPEGEETPPPASPEEEAGGPGATPVEGDTGAVGDSAGVDAAAVGEALVQEAGEANPADTAGGNRETGQEPEGAGIPGNAGAAVSEGVGDTAASPRQAEELGGGEPGRTPASPPVAGEARNDAREGVGAVGLAEAARGIESMTMWDRFNMDPAGNTLSVLVLLVMILSLVLRGYPPRVKAAPWPVWIIPALVLIGAGVAAYLGYIEVTHTEAVCGPVGDCNTVNQSEYATLFGFLPVGVLGLIGYGTILVLWVLRHSAPEGISRRATLGLWAASLFGTLFSVYLTFLEPFVIGATCAWCLTSAVIMTLLLWASSPLAGEAWRRDPSARGTG